MQLLRDGHRSRYQICNRHFRLTRERQAHTTRPWLIPVVGQRFPLQGPQGADGCAVAIGIKPCGDHFADGRAEIVTELRSGRPGWLGVGYSCALAGGPVALTYVW